MTNRPKKKRDRELEQALKTQKRSRQRKIRAAKVAILTLTVLVGTVIFVNSLGTRHPTHRLLLPTPSQYQQGILVNNVTQTFAFEYEWKFNFSSGSKVTLQLVLKGGTGVQVTFGTTAAVNTYTGPFLLQTILKPTDPARAWTGTLSSAGGYWLELGNLGSESDVCTIQLYAEAQVS